MDALVGSVLFVEFENFVVFANGSGPVVDVVFIKDNNGVALAARDSSADAYTHTIRGKEPAVSVLGMIHCGGIEWGAVCLRVDGGDVDSQGVGGALARHRLPMRAVGEDVVVSLNEFAVEAAWGTPMLSSALRKSGPSS